MTNKDYKHNIQSRWLTYKIYNRAYKIIKHIWRYTVIWITALHNLNENMRFFFFFFFFYVRAYLGINSMKLKQMA